MRWIALPLLFLLATPAAARDWPYTAIGRVERGAGAVCTGTLVGPRHVVTAAHCLLNPRTRLPMPAHLLRFVLGSGEVLAGVASILGDGYRPGTRPSLEAVKRDWGVLVLDRAVEVRPVPVLAKSVEGLTGMVGQPVLRHAAYGADGAAAETAACAIVNIGMDPALLQHDCAIAMGDSGTPLLVGRGDAAALIGVHVAILGINGYPHNLAVSAAAFAGGVARMVDDPAFSDR